MTDVLGIDADAMTVLTAIIAIETLVIIALIIRLLRKSGPTADLLEEILNKITTPKASEEDFSKIAKEKADERGEYFYEIPLSEEGYLELEES
ncbi:MAG: hypothetical protein HXS48_09150 [Theionarchaea archaeon]|nr:hypothetical protein [Theionarchaea archaeon]